MNIPASWNRVAAALLLLTGFAIGIADRETVSAQQECVSAGIGSNSKYIKVTVATGDFFSTPATTRTRYREGEAISAVVWMTNTSNRPLCVCSSAPLFQNRPELLKDGKQVPYIAGRSEWIKKYWDSYEPCMNVYRTHEQIELKPDVPTKVDWFIVSEGKQPSGHIKWYDTLGVGRYQITLTRKFDCCAGSETKSDSFNFEIVQDASPTRH